MVEPQQAALTIEQDADRVEAKLARARPLRSFVEERRSEAPDLTPLAFVQ